MRFVTVMALVLCFLGGEVKAMSPITGAEIAGGLVAGGFAAYKLIKGKGVDAVLYAAGYEAAVVGIQAAPLGEQRTIADATVKGVTVLKQYLSGTAETNAAAINAEVLAVFGGDPFILGLLQSVAPTLERYIPVASGYLSPQVLTYLGDFFQGVQDGAGAVLNTSVSGPPKVKIKYTTAEQHNHELKKTKAIGMHEGGSWFQFPVVSAKAECGDK